MNINPARKPGESYTRYRYRRMAENRITRGHLKGSVFWPSALYGTYCTDPVKRQKMGWVWP